MQSSMDSKKSETSIKSMRMLTNKDFKAKYDEEETVGAGGYGTVKLLRDPNTYEIVGWSKNFNASKCESFKSEW